MMIDINKETPNTPPATPVDTSHSTSSSSPIVLSNPSAVAETVRTIVLELPKFVKLFLILSTLLHILQVISPGFQTFVNDYLLYQPAKLFSDYLFYTPLTSLFLNTNVVMLLVNSVGIVLSFSFITRNHFLSEMKLLKFLMWNALFGALGALIAWTIAWSLTGNLNLLDASFPGATALLNSLNLLLAHFSPESPLPIHRKLRIRHLPGLNLILLVPITFFFVSWEDSVLCFAGLIGGWVVIRYIWQEKREQWRFLQVFFPDQLRSLFGYQLASVDLDLEAGPPIRSSSTTSSNNTSSNNSTTIDINPHPIKTITKNNRRLIGEQALMEKLKKKETEQKQVKPTTTTTTTTAQQSIDRDSLKQPDQQAN